MFMTSRVSPIRSIRRTRDLTVEQVAARANLASATVYRAERGIGTPEETTLAAIAEVLGVEVSDLHNPDASGPHDGAPLNDDRPIPTAA